jgi:Cys-rich protein (TIGR01571 family)
MATKVVVGQPVAAQLVDANGQPYVPLITGQFSSGECDCLGHPKSCLMACCCDCFTFAGIVTRAQIPALCNKSMSFNTCICVWITLVFLMGVSGTAKIQFASSEDLWVRTEGVRITEAIEFCCGALILYFVFDLRRKFRAKFSIPGSDPADCVWSWCCSCCVLAQMDRHLALNDRKCGCSDQGPHPGLAALEAGVQPLQPQAQ